MFLALIGGLLKVVLTFAWPSLAGTWADWFSIPIGWMRSMLAWLDTFPGASVPMPAPPFYLVAACFVLIAMTCFLRVRVGSRVLLVIVTAMAYLSILVIPVREAVLAKVAQQDDLRITLLSVGAGQCAVVETPGGRTIAIDAGSTSLTDLWQKCLGPFLHVRGRSSIDTVIISHGDSDHTSAVADVVNVYNVREVIAGARFIDNASEDMGTTSLLAELDLMERPPRIVAPGEVLPLGRDTRIEFLWPTADGDTLADNDAGLVLKLTHAGRSVLFPADIQDAGMSGLLTAPEKITADVLIAPHHGSSEKSTEAFVAAVNPLAVISSNGRSMSNKQRRFETLIGGRPLFRTNECGAVTITISRDGKLRVEPFLVGTMQAVELPRK